MRRKFWQSDAARRAGKLAAVLAAGAGVWLAVLPALGRLPRVRAYIAHNEQLQIDPSAKFYTELPAMAELLPRAQRAVRE